MAPLPTAAATSTNVPVTHMPIAHDAAAGADSGIAIKNTLSADDFRRMMNQMKGGAPTKSTQAASPASPMPAPTVPAEQNTDGAPLAANSKFTFENFVYGPENSLSLGTQVCRPRGRARHVHITVHLRQIGPGQDAPAACHQKRARREVARDQGQVCQLPGISGRPDDRVRPPKEEQRPHHAGVPRRGRAHHR